MAGSSHYVEFLVTSGGLSIRERSSSEFSTRSVLALFVVLGISLSTQPSIIDRWMREALPQKSLLDRVSTVTR